MTALLRTVLWCLAATLATGASAQLLPQPVRDALARSGIPADAAALVVRDVSGKDVVAWHNPAKSMNPASVMKLVTTAAALDLLGPAYTFRTEILAGGEIVNGVLEGDLIVKGYGDPKLTYDRIWAALRQLRERGLREVRGDLVFDRSFFAPVAYDAAKFDGKPRRAYNVGPDALLVNFKTVTFHIYLDGASVRAVAEPPIPSIELLTRLKPVPGPCGDWGERITFEAEETGMLATAQLSGDFPVSCGEKVWNASLFDHPSYDAALFRSLWTEAGGKLFGKSREGRAPADARLLLRLDSAPLADIVSDINKFSNNVMARQLFLTLSAEMGPPPAEARRSAEAIAAWMKTRGLDASALVLENGAGLSRIERFTAQGFAGLLEVMWKTELMPEFISSLPIPGVDGTLKKRLNGAAGQAHIKGGTLNDVRAIAGYVLDRNGKRWIVVFIVNHPNAAASQPAQDALLKWILAGAKEAGK